MERLFCAINKKCLEIFKDLKVVDVLCKHYYGMLCSEVLIYGYQLYEFDIEKVIYESVV